jgi:hypothetical protein
MRWVKIQSIRDVATRLVVPLRRSSREKGALQTQSRLSIPKSAPKWCAGAACGRKVFEALAADADNEHAMIDNTIVRAHQHSAGAQKRRPRPGDRAQ